MSGCCLLLLVCDYLIVIVGLEWCLVVVVVLVVCGVAGFGGFCLWFVVVCFVIFCVGCLLWWGGFSLGWRWLLMLVVFGFLVWWI